MKQNHSTFLTTILILVAILGIHSNTADGQVTIPVSFGSNPTCLGQMYSDILWPSGFVGNGYYNPNGPTAFANSNYGVVGLTIFFEVRPFAYESVYDSSGYGDGGSQAMAAVAATAINRSNSNNVDNRNAPGNPWLTMAAKDMSPSIWVVNNQGTGGLQSSMNSTLLRILNGSPQTQDCNGLMYSFAMAIAAVDGHANGILAVPQTANATNYYPGTLFFNTDGSIPDVIKARKPFLKDLGLANAPRYPSGAYPWYFWTITDATSYPANGPAFLY